MSLAPKRKEKIKERIEEMEKWHIRLGVLRWEALRRGDFKGSIRLFRQMEKMRKEIDWYQRKLK